MLSFDGLTAADFEYLNTRDAGYMPTLRTHLQSFGEAVHEKLQGDIMQAFPDAVFVDRWTAGQRGQPSAIIGRKNTENGPFKHCSFVLRLEPDGLHVNAVISDGRYGEKKSPITCLARAIDSAPAYFIRVMGGLGTDYEIHVFERKPIHGDRLMLGNVEWVPKHRMQAGAFDAQASANFRKMLETIEFPGIQIGLHIPKDRVLEMPAVTLARAASRAIQNLYWVIKFAESGALQ